MYATYCRLNVSIWDSNLTVIRRAHTKIAAHCRRDAAHREARKAFYLNMLSQHLHARALATQWRL